MVKKGMGRKLRIVSRQYSVSGVSHERVTISFGLYPVFLTPENRYPKLSSLLVLDWPPTRKALLPELCDRLLRVFFFPP